MEAPRRRRPASARQPVLAADLRNSNFELPSLIRAARPSARARCTEKNYCPGLSSTEGDGVGDGAVSISELFVALDGDGEASAELFLVVEDFFGDEDGDADASVSDFFFVVEALSVVVDFFAVVDPAVDFFAVVDALWVVAVLEAAVVSFLAQAVTNASAATRVIKDRTDFFIRCG